MDSKRPVWSCINQPGTAQRGTYTLSQNKRQRTPEKTQSLVNDSSWRRDFPIDTIRWDPNFNDPAAEIVLVSTDQIHFRVSRWHFTKASPLAVDMLSVPLPSEMSQSSIITGCHSFPLRIFVRLVYSSYPPPGPIPMQDLEPIRNLCDRLQCKTFIPNIDSALIACAESDPWRLFVIAASIESVDMARCAIRKFDKRTHHRYDVKDYLTGAMPAVDNGYAAELVKVRLGEMREMKKKEGTTWSDVQGFAVLPWAEVADEFFKAK